MKNILFLTDFSEPSIHAIHYACTLFFKEDVNYFLLHINKTDGLALSKLVSSTSVYDSLLGGYKEKIKALKKSLEDKYGAHFKASVRHDNFTDAVINYIAEYNIDIVVSGFDGAGSLQEKVFGNNTLKLIRSIPVSTLIIPQKAPIKTPQNVLCLLDEEDELKLVLQKTIFKECAMKIVRVVNTNNYTIANNDLPILKELEDVKYTYQLISNIPLHYVKSYILQTKKIDLTMLLVQETSVLERLFEDNSTAKINKSLIKPILITH